jgi:PAS domain S-box-containing protein
MKKDMNPKDKLSELRKQAENKTQDRLVAAQDIAKLSPEETHHLINELQVHQIELEMQNEELRRTQLELEAARNKYSDLYEFAPVGYFTISEKGMIVEANLPGATMLGVTRGSLTGSRFSDFITSDTQDIFYLHRKQVFKTKGKQTAELELVRKDGIQFHARMESTPLQNAAENVNEMLITISDITQRKRAEEALQDSKQRLDSIMRAVPDIIYRLDSNGNIDFISDAVRKYAYSPEELLNTNILQWVHPDDRKGAKHRINERRTKERATQLFEVRLFPKRPVDVLSEGESGDTQGELVFLITAEGLYESEVPGTETFMGTQGIARDVTERRRLEAQVRQTAKMEAVGTLAGGIAHDFNNLLMGIQGNVSLIKLDINPRHPSYERLEKIEKQIESGARLTSHLLGYARKGKYEVKRIDLNNLLKENAEGFGRTRKGITIRQELDDDLFTIEADSGQIQQVLFNLFINASDAMPIGGEIILKTMNTTHDSIKMKSYDPKPGNYVLLTVADAGIGMDKETMKHIFEPFFTTKEMGRGTGLGLASAYGIMKGHGGYINVESKKGQGTTFSIYLPASEKEVQRVVKTAEQVIEGTGTVLLVDDEEVILEVGQALLEAMGYRIMLARNGKEAIEVYRKNQDEIDIVVLDMVMPTIGGGEAYDRIKEINPDIKVLLSSGFSIDGEATEILQRGCNGFIQKPFRMNELSEKIREILDKK